MSGPVALAGWALAFAALAVGAGVVHELSRRMELVARACHELRGPLTAARLGLHLLTRREDATRPRLSAIDLELRRAGLALDDLHAAQLGRRARDREEGVDVGALLDEAAVAWRPVALAAETELRLDWPGGAAVVRGDPLRLAQACGNLVANAIEHGRGPVELRGRVTGELVRIEVIDAGPGLPAPVAELTRLARAGRGRRLRPPRNDGRGRGLAIAAEIATRHGGRLAAAPSAHGGRVAIELPLAGAARAAPA